LAIRDATGKQERNKVKDRTLKTEGCGTPAASTGKGLARVSRIAKKASIVIVKL
jgi:hypothetical protein